MSEQARDTGGHERLRRFLTSDVVTTDEKRAALLADLAALAQGAAHEERGLDVERWLPPTEDREPINIHPAAKNALRRLLMDDERLRGVGYSEFVMRAVRAYAATPEAAPEEGRHEPVEAFRLHGSPNPFDADPEFRTECRVCREEWPCDAAAGLTPPRAATPTPTTEGDAIDDQ